MYRGEGSVLDLSAQRFALTEEKTTSSQEPGGPLGRSAIQLRRQPSAGVPPPGTETLGCGGNPGDLGVRLIRPSTERARISGSFRCILGDVPTCCYRHRLLKHWKLKGLYPIGKDFKHVLQCLQTRRACSCPGPTLIIFLRPALAPSGLRLAAFMGVVSARWASQSHAVSRGYKKVLA
jgi:hypothetical protein